jgi:hypothetical protein
MPKDFAERPWIGSYERIGPDIEASGWGQRYSSPYILPANPPDYYHGTEFPMHDVRGRHAYRTQPRELGPYVIDDPVGMRPPRRPSLVESNPYYAHDLGGYAAPAGASGFGLEPSSLLYALGALLAIR